MLITLLPQATPITAQASPIPTNRPVVAATTNPNVLTPAMGRLTVIAANPDPGRDGFFQVDPGATVTLRIDGLRNIQSLQFQTPPDGWKGNGLALTPLLTNPGASAQIQVQIPTDDPGGMGNFSVQATGTNGQRLSSNMITLTVGGPPQIGVLSISPSVSAVSQGVNVQVVKPGSLITVRVDGLQNAYAVWFQVPPTETWGSKFVTTPPISKPGVSASVQITVPNRPGNNGLFIAVATDQSGRQVESQGVWAQIEGDSSSATATIPPIPPPTQ